MTGRLALVLGLALSAALAGCAGQPGTADPLQSAPPTASGWQFAPTAAQTVDSDAGSTEAGPWRLLGISDDRRSIDIAYIAGGGCTDFVGLLVESTPTSVTVTDLLHTPSAPFGQSLTCPADLRMGRTTLTLPQPVGDGISLMHGRVSGQWVRYAGDGSL